MKIKKTSNASYTNIYVNSVYGRSLKSFYGFPSLLNSYESNPFWKMFFIVMVSFMNLYFHSFNQLYDFVFISIGLIFLCSGFTQKVLL